jgi:hypothetical protein
MQEPFFSNSNIAELLALAAETAKMPLQKALRRASSKAFMWEEELPYYSSRRSVIDRTAECRPVLGSGDTQVD